MLKDEHEQDTGKSLLEIYGPDQDFVLHCH